MSTRMNEPQVVEGQRIVPPVTQRDRVGTFSSFSSMTSIKNKLVLSERAIAQLGWIVAISSLAITAIALAPGFMAQRMTGSALDLAKWTALKDFMDQCRLMMV